MQPLKNSSRTFLSYIFQKNFVYNSFIVDTVSGFTELFYFGYNNIILNILILHKNAINNNIVQL